MSKCKVCEPGPPQNIAVVVGEVKAGSPEDCGCPRRATNKQMLEWADKCKPPVGSDSWDEGERPWTKTNASKS